MIGKVSIGKTFGGCVHYVMEKDRAEVLDEKGVRIQNAIVATQDFNRIRLQNPRYKPQYGTPPFPLPMKTS